MDLGDDDDEEWEEVFESDIIFINGDRTLEATRPSLIKFYYFGMLVKSRFKSNLLSLF